MQRDSQFESACRSCLEWAGFWAARSRKEKTCELIDGNVMIVGFAGLCCPAQLQGPSRKRPYELLEGNVHYRGVLVAAGNFGLGPQSANKVDRNVQNASFGLLLLPSACCCFLRVTAVWSPQRSRRDTTSISSSWSTCSVASSRRLPTSSRQKSWKKSSERFTPLERETTTHVAKGTRTSRRTGRRQDLQPRTILKRTTEQTLEVPTKLRKLKDPMRPPMRE